MQEATAKQRILQELLNEGAVGPEEVQKIAAGEGAALQRWAAGRTPLLVGADGGALCDGASAEERAAWLVANQQMDQEAARKKVMQEFPKQFTFEERGSERQASGLSHTWSDSEPNPPRWPPTVKVLSRGSDYAVVDEIYEEMKSLDKGQFSKKRYALFFEASEKVHEVDLRVGYYTSVYGLGRHPSETQVRSVTSTNESPHPELGSLQNFWRSAENLQTGGHLTYSVDREGGMLWAVSQAAPLRRVVVDHNLFLWYLRIPPEGVTSKDARYPKQGVALDYDGWVELGYTDPIGDFASGGYMANVQVNGFVSLGSQQQFFARNCSARSWQTGGDRFHRAAKGGATLFWGSAWNFVFVGCPGAPHTEPGVMKAPVYSSVKSTQVIAEKPFIVKDPGDERYRLAVPRAHEGRVGVDFSLAQAELRDFEGVFVCEPRHTAAEINQKLAEGKDLVFCPGIYHLAETLNVKISGQVLLGLGFATLVAPQNDMPCIQVFDEAAGVRISGLMLEAFYRPVEGASLSDLPVGPEALLRIGTGAASSSAMAFSFIHDCFARVGGQEAPFTARDELDGSRPSRRPVEADTTPLFTAEARCRNMVQIHQPRVVGDTGHQALMKSKENLCSTGLHVAKGAHEVTMYGLFVEHTLSDMTLWEGEDGATYFYQSELPYDAEEAFRGCGYRVGEAVQRHRATGVGVYAYFRDHDVTVPFAIQAPDRETWMKWARSASGGDLLGHSTGDSLNCPIRKCLLQCEKKYGRIQCVVKKGDRCLGSSTDTDKDLLRDGCGYSAQENRLQLSQGFPCI
eukprot:g4389.t1